MRMVLLHPVVPNLYILLSQFPEGAARFIVLVLKEAFFCVPIAKESQFLFAFKYPLHPNSELT